MPPGSPPRRAYGRGGRTPENGIAGTQLNRPCSAYTLIKVVGRDVWIGIWAFVLSIISIDASGRRIEKRAARPNAAQIWWRFPEVRRSAS